jgi:hypothetical protein
VAPSVVVDNPYLSRSLQGVVQQVTVGKPKATGVDEWDRVSGSTALLGDLAGWLRIVTQKLRKRHCLLPKVAVLVFPLLQLVEARDQRLLQEWKQQS